MRITEKNGKKILSITKTEWENIGKQAGVWDKAKGAWQGAIEGWKGKKPEPINTNPPIPEVVPTQESAPVQEAAHEPAPVAEPEQNKLLPLAAKFFGYNEDRYAENDLRDPKSLLSKMQSVRDMAIESSDTIKKAIALAKERDINNSPTNFDIFKNMYIAFAKISRITPADKLVAITKKMDAWFYEKGHNNVWEMPDPEALKPSFYLGQYTPPEKRLEAIMEAVNLLKEKFAAIKEAIPLLQEEIRLAGEKADQERKAREDAATFAVSGNKVKISESQWRKVGRQAGWIK